jgi:hypothetical protein
VTDDPDFERLANTLIAIVLRMVVQDDEEKKED